MLQPLFSSDRAYGAPGRMPRRARRFSGQKRLPGAYYDARMGLPAREERRICLDLPWKAVFLPFLGLGGLVRPESTVCATLTLPGDPRQKRAALSRKQEPMATEKRRASARASKRGQGGKDNAKLFKARLQPRCKRVSSCLLTLRAIENKSRAVWRFSIDPALQL